MSDQKLIRDVFNRDMIENMGHNIHVVFPDFEKENFNKKANSFNEKDSFKERAHKIYEGLKEYLPNDFVASAKIIKDSFPINSTNEINWESFYYMPFAIYVEKHGCQKKYLATSFNLLKEITKRFTSEFAIRSFIIQFPIETLDILKTWVKDEDQNVRRLVSEGSRPRLPWAQALNDFKKDPTLTLELLEELRNDESKYVQKSVANHLNDITKDNPEIALKTLARWKKENKVNTNWIVKHALRSELKKGTPEALKILGYSLNPKLSIPLFNLSKKEVKLGEYLSIEFEIKNESNQAENLMIDYICHFMKANGKTAPKTFKISSKKLAMNDSLIIKKHQSFKPISTRKMYSGVHKIELFINGKTFGSQEFNLVI